MASCLIAAATVILLGLAVLFLASRTLPGSASWR
jgi:hypothetical protein